MFRVKNLLFPFIFCISVNSAEAGLKPHIDTVYNAVQLDSIVSRNTDSVNVYLMPGDYYLNYKCDTDTAIRVLNDQTIIVPYTYGLKIHARYVRIKGAPAYTAAIYTNAGYGLYFDGCRDAVIEGLIITGGKRDTSTYAPDAAIVARNSRLKVLNNIIFENYGDSSVLCKTKRGIMGICAREGSYVFVFNNQIARNTWHGIGIFRDATATITGNLIDGVDKSEDDSCKGGAGIGILVTRNGKATIESNLIKRYCKGIGIFNQANATITGNLIENISTWGIAVWDADTMRPVARIENNVVFKTGACGISITRYLEGGESGFCKKNVFIQTAQDRRYDSPDKYCYQCALAVQGRPDNFEIADNTFYKNFWIAPCFTSLDSDMVTFLDILQTQYSSLPLQWYAGYSEFIQQYFLYVSK